ncbi:hypothetical protein [Vibrio mediterranei]|uniref:hypothetical protein n=1 Tax=Vibrio mediterranei TaxID=689 RepID=UPI0040684036
MENPSQQRLKRQQSQTDTLVLGLPIKLFALASLFAGFGLLLSVIELGWILGGGIGLLFFIIVFTPLRWIHQEDHQAWLLWLDAIKHTSLSSNVLKKKHVSLMSSNGIISFKDWKNKDIHNEKK